MSFSVSEEEEEEDINHGVFLRWNVLGRSVDDGDVNWNGEKKKMLILSVKIAIIATLLLVSEGGRGYQSLVVVLKQKPFSILPPEPNRAEPSLTNRLMVAEF